MYFEGSGSEQSGWRPGVVFQNNVGNLRSPNLIVLPMTSSLKKLGMPTHVLISAKDTDLRCDSVVICENPTCISKSKVGKYITTLSEEHMSQIAVAHLIATSALSFVDLSTLASVRDKSIRLNDTS